MPLPDEPARDREPTVPELEPRGVTGADLEAGTARDTIVAESEMFESPPASLDVATPFHPIVPAAPPSRRPALSVSVDTPVHPLAPVSSPRAAPAESADATGPRVAVMERPPMGSAWKEWRRDDTWHAVLRPVSRFLVALIVAFAATVGGLVATQSELLGIEASVATGVGILVALLVAVRMAQATYFRFDAKELSIDRRPGSRTTSLPARPIEKFVVLDEGPAKDPHTFFVHALPAQGDPVRLDVELPTEADARFVARRLNDALADLRRVRAATSKVSP